jgi:hypothetical protein
MRTVFAASKQSGTPRRSVDSFPRRGSVELEVPPLHMTELADARASDLASRRIRVQRLTREMC